MHTKSEISHNHETASNVQGLTNSVDFFRLWYAVLQRRWLILTVTGIAFFTSMVYAFKQPDFYTSKVKIYVQNVDQSPLKKDEILMPSLDRTTYYRTQMELIKSRDILQSTAQHLELTEYYGRKPFETLRLLEKKISTKIVAGTQIIELSVKDKSPTISAAIANSLAENFVKQSLKDKLFISDQILKWFPNEAGALKGGTLVEQLKQMDREDVAGTLPSVLHDPVIQELKQDRAKVDGEIRELSKRYTPEHPRMKELQAKADYLEKEIKSQSAKVIAGIKAGLSGAFNVTDIKIVERAVPPVKPAGPNRFLIISAMTLGFFYLSVMLALFLEYVDQKVKTETDIKRVGLSFLGYLPVIRELSKSFGRSKDEPKLLQLLLDKNIPLNEIVDIRTGILFSMPKEKQKKIVITSAIPEEGKTTVASLLAVSFAEFGENTLLIDADMLRPKVHKYFGLENTRGLSHAVAGITQAKDCIQTLPGIHNLSILTAGAHTPNAAMLLNSEEFSSLIDEWARQFERIIIDIPPILVVADGLITTKKADGVVVVFGYDQVHLNTAKKVRAKLENTQCPIIGAVVNRANYRKTKPYEGYYYRHYTKYYYRGRGRSRKKKASETTLN